MAWLSGLADKAENLLNKIDKNTAAVLNKDKYDLPQPVLTEVTWVPAEPRHEESVHTKSTPESPRHFPKSSTTPNITTELSAASLCKDEDLLTFLNTPDHSPRKLATDIVVSPSTPSSLLVEHPTDTSDSVSEMSMQSNCSSSHFDDSIMDGEEEVQNGIAHLESDTSTRRSNEVLINGAQNQHYENTKNNGYLAQDNETSEIRQGDIDIPVDPPITKHSGKYFMEVVRTLEESNQLLGQQETDHQKEILVLNEKLQTLEAEKQQLFKQIVELQSALERSRLDLNSTRSDLEQHKARALRTLQEKEKLITELRCNKSTGMDDATLMELNQLRQERDILREENCHISDQVKIIQGELMAADVKLEKMRQKLNDSNNQAQEILATERRRRVDAEEDAKMHSEEVRSLKDELLRLRNTYTTQLQKHDSEIARLRMQLSTTLAPSSEMESRLASLTQTLVLKQQALESLTTERNALRLQLEKIEHEYRNTRRNAAYNNMNDTDDAKAQVPTFLLETPFDTGVTRRVKRAYSTLDAISIRTGVFLRRYPLARILVLIYMALLQFWVLVVLLSQSPDAH